MITTVILFLALSSIGYSQLVIPGGFFPPPLPPQQLFPSNCTAYAQYAEYLGIWHPTCNANSTYAEMQNHPSNITFCLTKDGRLLLNGTSQTVKSCICPRQRYETLNSSLIGGFVPACDQDGTFSAMQFHASSGYVKCFSQFGIEILSGRNIRACKCPRARFETMNPPRVGNYVPQCETNGTYTKRQTHGSTGYSWCVNEDGVQVSQAVPPYQYQTLSC